MKDEEDEAIAESAVRRTQLGELRDEIGRLEKTVGSVNARVKSLADGNLPEVDPAKTREQPTPRSSAPIQSLTQRVKSMRLRLENGALERLSRIGTD